MTIARKLITITSRLITIDISSSPPKNDLRCIQRSNLRIHMRGVHKKELPRWLFLCIKINTYQGHLFWQRGPCWWQFTPHSVSISNHSLPQGWQLGKSVTRVTSWMEQLATSTPTTSGDDQAHFLSLLQLLPDRSSTRDQGGNPDMKLFVKKNICWRIFMKKNIICINI